MAVPCPVPVFDIGGPCLPIYVFMYARDNEAGEKQSQEQPTSSQVEVAVAAFLMLGDATRLRLMWLLAADEYDVNSLAEAIGAPQRRLCPSTWRNSGWRGWSAPRRDGGVLYRARDAHVRRLIGEALFHADHEVSGIPRHEDRNNKGTTRSVSFRMARREADTGYLLDELPPAVEPLPGNQVLDRREGKPRSASPRPYHPDRPFGGRTSAGLRKCGTGPSPERLTCPARFLMGLCRESLDCVATGD